MVDTRSGKSTMPYSKAQEEQTAAILRERKEKKEIIRQATMKMIAGEQTTKKKKLEEEMKRLHQEEEERMKVAVEEEIEEEEQPEEEHLIRRRMGGRGESSGTKEDDPWVLGKLRETNFKINAKKCEWAKTQVFYLGHVLDGDGIKLEDSKIAAIRGWRTPRTMTELRSFLGLANYYRKFARNFSAIAAPLRRLLKKDAIWKWDKDCTSALKKLKRALIEYPVLKVADSSLPFVVTTDASQYGIGAVLQQDDDNGYRPVEFMSARMPSDKVATSTYERELYGLRQALEHWKHLLGRHFKVYSDHETLRVGGRGESSGPKEDLMEEKITEWVAGLSLGEDDEALMYVPRDEQEAAVKEWEAEEDPLKRLVLEDEKRMEWKFRLTRERKRRMEAASQAAIELEEIKKQKDQMAVQVDLLGKMEIMAKSIERLTRVQEEQLLFGRSQDIAVRSIQSGLRDFARELVTQVGSEVTARLDSTERYCTGAIEGARLTAPKEEEARPRREPVKVKFPDAYSGKKEENFDNWEANIKTYVHLQKVSPDEHVLVAIHALKEEAASFARSLVRAANCNEDVVAYSAFTPLADFLKLLRERFADVSRSVKASDRLQTIHSRQWRSAKALKGLMDELVAVPDHGFTETQLVNLFYRAMHESLRGHFFEKSQQPTMTYDALSREVVAFEARSMSVSTFWHKDLDKGKKWKGHTISGQIKTKDRLLLTLDEGSVEEVPYDQIEWGLEEEKEDGSASEGRTYAAVAAGGRPQGRGGQGQGGRASGGHFQGDQGVGGRGGNRQAGGRGQGSPQNRFGNRSPNGGMDWGEAAGATLHLREHECRLPRPSGEVKIARLFHASGVDNTLAHCCLSAPAFARLVKKEKLKEQVFVVYVKPVTEPKEEKPIDPAIAKLLEEFKDLVEPPTGVVPWPIQHRIEIEPGSRTPKGAVYRMSPRELEELRKQLDELLEKGWIRPSSSPFGAPVLFVPKKEGELRMFVVVYLDDILIFSKTLQEHQGHLKQVLEKLREANFKINPKKCEWAKTQVLYLGHVLDGDGIKPEDSKIAAIRDWPTPRTLIELRSFLGLANYYRKFVRNFSTIAAPLRRLLRKETIWKWDKDCTSAMKKLKQALIEYPVLKVADPSLPFVVTTDASQYGIGVVLQQDDGNGYRPVEFMSARMPSEKVATSTYERELYALRQALHWKHYLLGRHFKVYSDHETLRWLKTRAKMTPKLTRWAAERDQYDFELKPVKGKYNVVVDALSRRLDYFGAIVHYLDIGRDLQEKVRQAYAHDPIYSDLLKRVKEAPKTEPDYRTTEGLLFENRRCVPNSEEIRSLILGECHYTEGHFGWQKTLANLMRAYIWPGMKNDCIEYVRSCKVCQRNKTTTCAPLGFLRPLPIPDQPGDSVSIDFMESQVKSRHGKSQVMVIVDCFSKYVVFVPFPFEARTELVVQKFFDHWVSEHGIPLSILSDRDTRFTSQNWQELVRVYGSKLLMSSGRHPETNDQTEQMNKVLQQVMRMYVRPDQINWDEMLPKVASAYNNSVHLSTCRTPNELHKSFRPRRPFDGLNRDQIQRLPPGTREFALQHGKELATVIQNLRKAQHRMIEQANKHRRPSQFQVGDLVWVKSKEFVPEENISQKLLPAYRGPWPVLEVKGGEDGPSYTIEIPAHLHTYPVFHASKLLPCVTSQEFPSRQSMIPPDMDERYDIDGIVYEDVFRTGGRGRPQKQYKVQFAYQEPEDDRWFTRSELLETAPDIVRAYERDQRGKGPALD
ncbi:hypothetical protein CBR_g38088 [Chara braunii]|uniref:Integrase catalytic domain-containing protein n=1 Tax=Chara braunii TaxID=69332 RepID=A0A388K075_CHABU|nr:hypothetical protein CBR_g38088 [Chara braunii]|eukprot:GBG63470.1 hypothetical protein CBR_g38088 [Chara braunii]